MPGVIARNERGLRPRDAARLAGEIRRRLGARSVNVRIASSHVEVSAEGVSPEDLARAVEDLAGRVIGGLGGAEGLASYMALIEEERYWEAHEALEAVWSRDRDPAKQVLILAAAALAKAQEGKLHAALKIAGRAKKLQEALGEDLVDIRCVEAEAEKAYRGERSSLRRCLKL